MDKLAQTGNPEAYAFPRAFLEEDNFDFSFSGLKSAVANEVAKRRQRGRPSASPTCARVSNRR
ncbi:hypothetical protein GCM10025857_17350 [Alicyclobacillus contaminans]|nr:hypothetical protein GCM10025857_17350 [Alicyclobacillus contaminans]